MSVTEVSNIPEPPLIATIFTSKANELRKRAIDLVSNTKDFSKTYANNENWPDDKLPQIRMNLTSCEQIKDYMKFSKECEDHDPNMYKTAFEKGTPIQLCGGIWFLIVWKK